MPSQDLSRFDIFVIVGGDGTINEAISAYMQNETQSTPVAIFPGGTGNDFCRSLNIFNYDDALNALLMGMSFQCDIGMFQTENRTRAFLT